MERLRMKSSITSSASRAKICCSEEGTSQVLGESRSLDDGRCFTDSIIRRGTIVGVLIKFRRGVGGRGCPAGAYAPIGRAATRAPAPTIVRATSI